MNWKGYRRKHYLSLPLPGGNVKSHDEPGDSYSAYVYMGPPDCEIEVPATGRLLWALLVTYINRTVDEHLK
jgi:hypothetical protein